MCKITQRVCSFDRVIIDSQSDPLFSAAMVTMSSEIHGLRIERHPFRLSTDRWWRVTVGDEDENENLGEFISRNVSNISAR